MHLHPVGLSEQEVEDHYEGFSNETLWPLYHDVIVPPRFRRRWFDGYRTVNRRFAEAAASLAAPGATVWVHDYQLQLVPAMLRELRPDVRIGWFNHIPFPGGRAVRPAALAARGGRGPARRGPAGLPAQADADNFLRVCRRLLGLRTKGGTVSVHGPHDSERDVRAAAVPDLDRRATASTSWLARPEVIARAQQIRARPRRPRTAAARRRPAGLHQGDPAPAQGLRGAARRTAWSPRRSTVLVQVATPSRERVSAYIRLREQVEVTVGRANGDYGQLGRRPSTTCTSPTRARRWPRCSWPPT